MISNIIVKAPVSYAQSTLASEICSYGDNRFQGRGATGRLEHPWKGNLRSLRTAEAVPGHQEVYAAPLATF
jgi:hypothetical protein